MSKKDFEAIANIYKDNNPSLNRGTMDASYDVWRNMVMQFVVYAKTQNTRFDEAKFFSACGMYPGEWS